MKYMGSKARFAKDILPIVLKGRERDTYYIEPFVGGGNLICNVTGNRIANDIHPYLIAMWVALIGGWVPDKITKEYYEEVRANKGSYPPHIVGWVGFNCSYSGKYFGGYAGDTKTKFGTIRDYQSEAIRNVLRQVEGMRGIVFKNEPYFRLQLPPRSIVYCDPPYEGTTQYANEFDHQLFWAWVREVSKEHKVYVSEYNAPEDFKCIWSTSAKSSLSANGSTGGSKESIERLFVHQDSTPFSCDSTKLTLF